MNKHLFHFSENSCYLRLFPQKTMGKKIELLAPAGSFESLNAAINAGADAVYFGASHLNMRAKSINSFSLDDLEELATLCKEVRKDVTEVKAQRKGS